MDIRKAELSDAYAIALIHRSARTAAMPWLPVLHTPDEDLAFFAEQVLPNQSVPVIECGGSPAGFIAVHDGWLNHLYVAPGHWRRGVGSRLLTHARNTSGSLQLWVFQQNRAARSFYARHGFREVEFTDGSHNEEKAPDVHMAWSRGAG